MQFSYGNTELMPSQNSANCTYKFLPLTVQNSANFWLKDAHLELGLRYEATAGRRTEGVGVIKVARCKAL